MDNLNSESILVVDDETQLREGIAAYLNQDGYEVQQASTGEEALTQLRETPYDILITDMKLPGVDGNKVLQEALSIYPDLIGIIITGYGTVESAVQAMKNGAYDYISKPFQLMEVSLLVKQALERRRLRLENAYLKTQLKEKYRFENIIGNSKPMQEVFQLVETIAVTNSTVLITGETGTGKELIARAIHFNSLRKEQKIVSINCGAIPETLLESELFGHVKGAFTGAHQTRIGRFEQAHKGTIFLDEIGTMSPSLQVKLLRVLQEREFERVGGMETIKVDVRIIAATSANLKEMVERNEYRSDLYYRLNVIPVHLAALRDRREDIPLLTKHFVKKYCQNSNMEPKTVAQEAMKMLMNYSWPGNIRQLENAIERAVALVGPRNVILPSDLPAEVQKTSANLFLSEIYIPDEGVNFNTEVSNVEKELIMQSLRKSGGNKKQAAKLLNLKRTTLIEKLKRLNLMDKTDQEVSVKAFKGSLR
ncbi:MAG TPA: sigma-54 dependent transcriptional regulator [Terriglobia bacterium]|nr:sigma-54 dependent transcriptional regulator [Terriglobia bacterium]